MRETFLDEEELSKASDKKKLYCPGASKREAMNMPIQGTCADIIKVRYGKISKELKTRNLQAHLIMQSSRRTRHRMPRWRSRNNKKILHDVMENIVNWDIPMAVEVGVGKNWLEAKGKLF